MNIRSPHPGFALAALVLLPTLALTAAGRQGTLSAARLECLSMEEREILAHLSLVELDDGQGGTVTTLRITGLNLQIVNGLGATNGDPASPDTVQGGGTATNGLGNLIVGYNELGNPDGDDRTGSHNIVFGHGNTYSSFGGLVGPHDCSSEAPYTAVSGGRSNRATGVFSAVSGGTLNVASGPWSVVAAGAGNTASGTAASVTGGGSNLAETVGATVSGGAANTATDYYYTTVSGGFGNTASGYYATVSGGLSRTADGDYDWRAGGLFEDY